MVALQGAGRDFLLEYFQSIWGHSSAHNMRSVSCSGSEGRQFSPPLDCLLPEYKTCLSLAGSQQREACGARCVSDPHSVEGHDVDSPEKTSLLSPDGNPPRAAAWKPLRVGEKVSFAVGPTSVRTLSTY